LSAELPTDLSSFVDHFGLIGVAPVIKDFHGIRAIAAINSAGPPPFRLIFAGSTALAAPIKLSAERTGFAS